MAWKVIKETYNPALKADECEIIMDSEADSATLPNCCPGSIAMVAEEKGAIFVVNASGEWKKI